MKSNTDRQPQRAVWSIPSDQKDINKVQSISAMIALNANPVAPNPLHFLAGGSFSDQFMALCSNIGKKMLAFNAVARKLQLYSLENKEHISHQ